MCRVSIGLPVYNGERYLAQTLESLRAQSFDDYEIVICDNASGDGTERIAREAAARDPRIRYHRQPRNVGAAANFNRAFELARGTYFKWAAADDLCEPEFLERCVAVLDHDPSVVLAHPRTRMIDGAGRDLGTYDLQLSTDSRDTVERFGELLRGHMCFEVFGLIRREAVARARAMGAFNHGDGVLLVRLALQGRFVEIPEPLFVSRRHPDQSGKMIDDRQSWTVWFNPAMKGKLVFPHWRMNWELLRSLWLVPLDSRVRARCFRILARRIYGARRLLREDLMYHAYRIVGKQPAR